jgi:hypothetical protein
MLRCTISGLIPLMISKKYATYGETFYKAETQQFKAIIRHESYYLIRKLPVALAERLMLPELPSLLSGQKKNGMWKVKDTERITYDILSALKYIGQIDKVYSDGSLRYNPAEYIKNKYGFYSLLIKANILRQTDEKDKSAIATLVAGIKNKQKETGSWDDTVIGTVVNMENLLDLNVRKDDTSILHGVKFLFSNLNSKLAGIHTTAPYGLVADNIFTTENRNQEFMSATKLRPEWIPRKLCFRTLAIIPDTVCLTLLVSLGMENDNRVEFALDNIYQLYAKHGGLCASNIKQPYI